MCEYGLSHEGNNPHRFSKNIVRLEALKNLFGACYGDLAWASFCWLNCKVPEVVARIKFLHPILYQHGPGEISNNVKVKFAEGVIFEYEKGVGFVDWCAFGVDTNEWQHTCYYQDLAKLEALRKSFEGNGNVNVREKDWRSIKVELGMETWTGGATVPHGWPPLRMKEDLEPAMTKILPWGN